MFKVLVIANEINGQTGVAKVFNVEDCPQEGLPMPGHIYGGDLPLTARIVDLRDPKMVYVHTQDLDRYELGQLRSLGGWFDTDD